jgi:hypothetical protein
MIAQNYTSLLSSLMLPVPLIFVFFLQHMSTFEILPSLSEDINICLLSSFSLVNGSVNVA